MNQHDFGPLPTEFPGPKAEKQINLDLVKTLRMLLTQAENGDIIFMAGLALGPAGESIEAMVLQPGPAEHIMHTGLEVIQAKIISNLCRAQGAPQKPSAILKPR